MQIKDIVAVTDLSGDQKPAQLAVDLAVKANAHVTGMAPVLEPITPAYLAGPLPSDILDQARKSAEDMADSSLDAFNELVRVQGVSGEAVRFRFVEGAASGLVNRVRLSDLAVIGQETPNSSEPGRAAVIEALLFETGVPVMVVPYISKGAFEAKHMMVAWDGGVTAAPGGPRGVAADEAGPEDQRRRGRERQALLRRAGRRRRPLSLPSRA